MRLQRENAQRDHEQALQLQRHEQKKELLTIEYKLRGFNIEPEERLKKL